MLKPKIKIYFVDSESFDHKIGEKHISYTTSIEHPHPQYVTVVFEINGKEYPIQRIQSFLVRTDGHRDQMNIDFYGEDLVDLVKLSQKEYEEKFRKG